MGIGLFEGFAAIWNVATATVPFAMTLLLNPTIRQLFPEHEIDFPASVAAVPATTVTPVMSEGKLNVHCRPVLCAPPVDAKLIGRAIVPPGTLEPDPSERVTLCAHAAAPKASKKR